MAVLPIIQIYLGAGGLLLRPVPIIAHNAASCLISRVDIHNDFSHRFTTRPKPPCHRLVDHRNAFRLWGVVLVQVPPGTQWNLHRLKVVMVHETRECDWELLPWIGHALSAYVPTAVTPQRQRVA